MKRVFGFEWSRAGFRRRRYTVGSGASYDRRRRYKLLFIADIFALWQSFSYLKPSGYK